MLEILSQVGLNASQFIALVLISAFVLILAYRPFVINILDPLNVFILAMVADVVLMLGLDWEKSAKVEFCFFVLIFWIGFVLAGKVPLNHAVIHFDGDAWLELEIILVVTTLAIVVGNLYLGMTAGFPLFSANPSDAKVTTYTGGLGLIRHLDQGPYLFVCCGCMLLISIGRTQLLAMSMLAISSLFVAFSGAKGALLPILFVQSFVMYHKGLGQKTKYSNKIKKLAVPVFAAASVVALAVLIRENGGLSLALVALGKRLLFFGDVILFYYPRRGNIPGLAGVGPVDYIHYLVDPILGMFRVVDYSSIRPPLGTAISDAELGFGPNAQYFVRADIFFGPYLGCVYCLALGYLSGILRKQFFSCQTKSAVVLSASLLLAISAMNLPTESSFVFSNLVDTVLFITPLWLFARVATYSTSAAFSLRRPSTRT